MQAVVWDGPDRVSLSAVPDPVPIHDTDAVVAVRLAGVCGTDLHVSGGHSPGMRPGTVLGHEFVGTVVAAGAGVRRAVVGTEVMSSDFTACGTCWWCDRGEHWHCTHRQFFGTGGIFGPELAGAQAQFVRVPYADTVLAPLPPRVRRGRGRCWPATTWPPAGSPGNAATPVPATSWRSSGAGRSVSSRRCARRRSGVAVVVVSDPVPARLDLARAHGAVGAHPDELRAVLDELTQGRGADVVVEAVGAPVGLELALRVVRRAGVVVSVGAHTEPAWPLPLAAAFTDEITLTFAIGDPIRARRALLPLLAAGVLDPTFVVSDTVPLSEAPSAYARMRERSAMKVLLELG